MRSNFFLSALLVGFMAICVGCGGGTDSVVAPSTDEEAAAMQAEMEAYEAELAAEEANGP